MKLQRAGIEVSPAVVAPLDPDFLPAVLFNREYRELVSAMGGVPLKLALERGDGSTSTYCTSVCPTGPSYWPATVTYVERIVKFLLWQRGGWRLFVGGPAAIGEHLKVTYSPNGPRKFDAEFMGSVYEHPFEVVMMRPEDVPEAREMTLPLGRHLDGCRVGFDLGASDRKASAVIDGEVVFSEEIAWDPRRSTDPHYHYQGVMDSIQRAGRHLPRLDAVGGSAAGVYINNRVRVGSLYRGVPPQDFAEKIAPLFLRIRDQLGVPLEVVNDGEVTALAGSMSLGSNPVLGIALGSSQAGGYVNAQGNITGWLNELAFVPVDYRADAPADEWSGDTGCGVQYFSQVAAHRVASGAGMTFEPGLGLPERLVTLQEKMQAGEALAAQIYETLGCYLGYGLAHYVEFYDLKHVLILGRVTTGRGGEILFHKAVEVLRTEFPRIAECVSISLPDEANRRVGQSIAAASLPAIRGGTK
jgi:predicted NBD/HSP70 family sugar kinase